MGGEADRGGAAVTVSFGRAARMLAGAPPGYVHGFEGAARSAPEYVHGVEGAARILLARSRCIQL